MSLYKQKYNPLAWLGFSLVPTANVITFKAGVANQAALPLSGNTQNDARIANDTGLLYVWSIPASSGLLTDWISQGDILTYTWDGLEGKPSSSITNIDDAVSKRHTQGTDQKLDNGGANEVTAAQVKQAVTDDHTHSNKSILDNIQEALTTALKSAYDGAVSLAHSHANISVLNSIQEALTTALKSAYDGAVSASHARQHGIASTSDHTSTITSGKMIKADSNGLPSEATNSDSQVAGAVSNSHAPHSDDQVIPDQLSDLSDDATHRLVTDTEKSTWNGKQDALGFTPIPNTRQVNGHQLSSDVTVTKTDVGLGNVPNLDTTNAVNNQHTHANISVLNSIQEALTTVLKSAYDSCVTFIGNFALGTPAVDDVLKWNGSQFVPGNAQQTGFTGVSLFLDDTASGIGSYNSLLTSPDTATSEELDNIVVNANTVNGEGYISGELGGTQIDSGLWEFDVYRYISSGTAAGTTELIFDFYKRTSGGVLTLLFSIATGDVNDTTNTLQTLTTVQPAFAINPTDRLVIQVKGHRIEAGNRTITYSHNGTTHYSHIHTPLVLRHNDLAGLQGGTSGEYNHLTNAQVGDVQSITDISLNIMLNAFRIAQIGSLTIFNMVKGFVDEYEDESGIDLVNSINQTYDSANDFYKNYSVIDAETVLLLHLDNDVIDSELTPKTVTNNNVTFGTGKFSQAGSFNGTSSYLSVPDSDDFAFGSGDFTIDFWVNFTSVSGLQGIFWQSNGNNDETSMLFSGSAKTIGFYNVAAVGGIKAGYLFDFDPSINTWYHIAIVRNGTTLKGYNNGTEMTATVNGAVGTNTFSDPTGVVTIGRRNYNSDLYLNGKIDEFRVSKGIARWVSNFTPPSIQYPILGNMTLLSNAQAATITPVSSRIVLFEEDVDSITLNTDLKTYVSRDNGTTFSQITLIDEGNYITGARILSGVVDISGQPSGTNIKYKIETLNLKKLNLHGTAISWK